MLYIHQFHHNRQHYLKQCQQHVDLLFDENFSLCSNKYTTKLPKIYRPTLSNAESSSNQTVFVLTEMPPLEMSLEKMLYKLNMIDAQITENVQTQTEYVWTHVPDHKSTIETRRKIGTLQENKVFFSTVSKIPIVTNDRRTSNDNQEKASTFSRPQYSSNAHRPVKVTTVKRQSPSTVLIRSATVIEPHRPLTAPLVIENKICRTTSEKIKPPVYSETPTLSRNARLTEKSENYKVPTHVSYYQFKATLIKSDNHLMRQPSHIYRSIHSHDTMSIPNSDNCMTLSADTTSSEGKTSHNDDEPKVLYRSSQHKMNGLQHIANLGTWQRCPNTEKIELLEKPKEIEHVEPPKEIEQPSSNTPRCTYEFKSPFSDEYDQVISFHAHCQSNALINEWNIKEFYRDVKTPFEPDTNTKAVFEKCLKLARLQANTIKWEQRRRQNLNAYNRLIKNGTYDNNTVNQNGMCSSKSNNDKELRDINELKRELRCNECRRLACLGNCAPGNEYFQYKRYPAYSSLPNAREPARSKLSLRTQRSTPDLRPPSQQQIIRETKFKLEQTTVTPLVIVPVDENESQTKRSTKKITHRYLPSKTLRSQRREPLTLITTSKVTS